MGELGWGGGWWGFANPRALAPGRLEAAKAKKGGGQVRGGGGAGAGAPLPTRSVTAVVRDQPGTVVRPCFAHCRRGRGPARCYPCLLANCAFIRLGQRPTAGPSDSESSGEEWGGAFGRQEAGLSEAPERTWTFVEFLQTIFWRRYGRVPLILFNFFYKIVVAYVLFLDCGNRC